MKADQQKTYLSLDELSQEEAAHFREYLQTHEHVIAIPEYEQRSFTGVEHYVGRYILHVLGEVEKAAIGMILQRAWDTWKQKRIAEKKTSSATELEDSLVLDQNGNHFKIARQSKK